MKNLLEALNYIHSQNIVHRDLKPENIILKSKDNDYDLSLADFGLAARIEEEMPLERGCGSPGYIAPELLNQEGYGTKADMFSAGAIMHILLTGKKLFYGKNAKQLTKINQMCEIKYPSKLWENISE